MNLPELQQDEALRCREFPVSGDKVYLAHAGVSPVPACVERAVASVVSAAARDDQEEGLSTLLRQTRTRASELLGADPGEVALIGPTTTGIAPSLIVSKNRHEWTPCPGSTSPNFECMSAWK